METRKVTREDILREHLYDTETGLFSKNGIAQGWSHRGYRYMTVNGVTISAHRAAFVVIHGKHPDGVIDHINGDKQDNRPENIRDTSQYINAARGKKHKDNTTGAKNVFWDKSCKLFYARCSRFGKRHYIGHFKEKEAAVAAVEKFNAENPV